MPRTLIATLLLLVVSGYANADPLTLSGKVLSEGGAPIGGAAVEINGSGTLADHNGEFLVSVTRAPVYALRYEADGHFPIVHS